MKYVFAKDCELIRIVEEIKLNPIFTLINKMDKEGSEFVVFTDADLSESDLATLNALVVAHNPVDVPKILKKKVLRSIEFGQEIIIEFSVESKLMGLTDEQMLQTSLALGDIQRLLGSGSLGLAKAIIDTISPIPIILEASRIAKYSNLIQEKINKL